MGDCDLLKSQLYLRYHGVFDLGFFSVICLVGICLTAD